MIIYVSDTFEDYEGYLNLLDVINDWVCNTDLSRKAISQLIYVYQNCICLIDDELDLYYPKYDIENPEKWTCFSDDVRNELIEHGMLYKLDEVDDDLKEWFEDRDIDIPEELWVLEDYCKKREEKSKSVYLF